MHATVHRDHELTHCWQTYPTDLGSIETGWPGDEAISTGCRSDWWASTARPLSWTTFFDLRDHTVVDDFQRHCTWLESRFPPKPELTPSSTETEDVTMSDTVDDADTIMAIPPPPRTFAIPANSMSPVIDMFLLAAIMHQGVRLLAEDASEVELYDFASFFRFSQSVINQHARHEKTTPHSRLKALHVWYTPDRVVPQQRILQGVHLPVRMLARSVQLHKIKTRLAVIRWFVT